MSQPSVLILRAPGTNCDQETAYAFEQAGAQTQSIHINQLIEDDASLDQNQILCLPGGFSYGDDIGAGRVLASRMQSKLADAIHKFHDAGKLVLGICNGFQILIKTGFLLPADDQGLPATLTWNDSGCFLDRWVNLKADGQKCVFLKDVDAMVLPIAHAEGKFVARSQTVIDQLRNNNQLALTYADGENPNGSTADVAGVCSDSGRIFGLMPHPERFIDATHHPRWTRLHPDQRGGVMEKGQGMAIFDNAVEFFA